MIINTTCTTCNHTNEEEGTMENLMEEGWSYNKRTHSTTCPVCNCNYCNIEQDHICPCH